MALLNFYFGFFTDQFSSSGVFESKGLNTILNYPKTFKFDLVLHDFTFGPCLLGILKHFHHYPQGDYIMIKYCQPTK
jgi:glucuronosyltransferase